MSTKDVERELEEYYQEAHERGPDQSRIRSSSELRHERMEAAKQRITIRIDEDVIQEFKRLALQGRGYQSLINHALREWLAARGVKELIREELGAVMQREFAVVMPKVSNG